jgi:hypothetical protein
MDNDNAPVQSTVLTGKKDDVTFEMWIQIDGRPLKVYGEAEMDGGGSEAWIASENGKVCCLEPFLLSAHFLANATEIADTIV